MNIKKIVIPNGGQYDHVFKVGSRGVSRIAKNPEVEGAYIVFLKNSEYREIDIKAQNILVFWD